MKDCPESSYISSKFYCKQKVLVLVHLYARQNNASPQMSTTPICGTWETLHNKRDFTDMIKGCRFLRWENYPGLSRWAQSNPKDPYKREVAGSESERDLKLKGGAKSHEIQAASRSWKGKEIDSPLEPPERKVAQLTL